MRIRIVTFNAKGLGGGRRTADALEALEPDVLLLQESGGRRHSALARALRMEAAVPARSLRGRPIRNAVLVRPPWRVVARRLHRFPGSTLQPRGALLAQIGRAGRRLWVASVHLGLAPAERLRHARELTDVCASLAGPVVIGGDLNEAPGGRTPSWIGDRYWDTWLEGGVGGGETFPAAEPTARIDYVFASEGLAVELAEVGGDPGGSDHLPVVVELELGD